MGITLRHNIIRGNVSIGTSPVPAGLLSPAQIFGSNLVEWWRPEELSSYANGSPMNNGWLSVGSFASTMQASSGQQPTIFTYGAMNGYRGLDFNGTTDKAISNRPKNDYSFITSDESYIFIVAKITTGVSGNQNLMSNFGSNFNGFVIRYNSPGGNDRIQIFGGDNSSNNLTFNVLNDPEPDVFNWSVWQTQTDIPTSGNTNTNSAIMGLNDNSLPIQNTTFDTTNKQNPDEPLNFGYNTSNNTYYDGVIMELGIVNRTSTLSERQLVDTYLQNKYGGTFPI